MSDSFLTTILPQLASGAAHTHALGFAFEGLHDASPRIRVPYRPEWVGDPDTGVLAGGLVTTLLDHVGGLAVWVAMDAFKPGWAFEDDPSDPVAAAQAAYVVNQRSSGVAA